MSPERSLNPDPLASRRPAWRLGFAPARAARLWLGRLPLARLVPAMFGASVACGERAEVAPELAAATGTSTAATPTAAASTAATSTAATSTAAASSPGAPTDSISAPGATTSAPPETPGAAPEARAAGSLARDAAEANAPPVVRVSELAPAAPPDACPPIMVFVPGGDFWMGSPRGRGGRAERPRFRTQVADFCLDRYEVTSSSYEACVRSGACSAPHGNQSRCNYGRREDHPINCVDWTQADTYCKAQGSRLPSELEWEYAARGGERYLPFSWGIEPPEGRTCWKANMSCPVGSFGTGAFDLHDMSGNVWEWTADWFGDYPWPEPSGSTKVFRGGGFNGQSERWLGATLRNRTDPERWGSYLGFRCARLAKEAVCPFGPGDEPGRCRHGVLDVECSASSERFNGQRCATAKAPLCEPSSTPVAGHGCVKR